MVSEIARFYGRADVTSSWFIRQGALHAVLYDGIWMRKHDFLIAFHSNVLSGMHGFWDNEVLLPTGYDVIVIYPPGGALGNFSSRILKERPWLPDSVPYYFFYLGCMVSKITRFYCKPDMTSWFLRQEALYAILYNGFWKRDPSFIIMVLWHISRISYLFGVIRHFILVGKCPFWTILGVFFRIKHPQISQLHIAHLPYTRTRLLSYCARKLVHGYGL